MRVMEIPSFPRTIDIPDLENLLRARLSQTVVMWPSQAIPLLGYMCCPNDPQARQKFVLTVQSWPEESTAMRPDLPAHLGRIQKDWLRVADVFHLLCDLAEGRHQARRGGPSVGKQSHWSQPRRKAGVPEPRACGKFGRLTKMSHTWLPPRR